MIEAQIHVDINKAFCELERLKQIRPKTYYFSYMPFGEKRDMRTAVQLKRKGVRGGFPDFIFIDFEKGHNYFFEVKTDTGKLSPDQITFFRGCEMNDNMFFFTIRSVDEFLKTLAFLNITHITT
ncbi:MAG: VRR-NUC domain-containing protein [Rickettsiales bacterium]|jgi:hypothetical protein|nr:VRR-NUC domain-containing protein [Rickettsiales bacterium]